MGDTSTLRNVHDSLMTWHDSYKLLRCLDERIRVVDGVSKGECKLNKKKFNKNSNKRGLRLPNNVSKLLFSSSCLGDLVGPTFHEDLCVLC
jgi:hypothetical protein